MMRILRLRVVLCRFRGRSCFRWFCRLGRRTSGPHRRFPGERQHEGFVLAFLPLFLHRKALRRTVLCAYAARHAFLAVDRPLPCLPVDRDRLHRAAVLTASAEEAFLDVILHMMRILRLRHVLCRFRGRDCFRCFCLRWFCGRLCSFRWFCRRTGGTHRSLSGEREHEGFVLAFLPLFLHRKALRRTVLCAYAARHAFLAVDRPLPCLPVDRDRLHRAAVLTASAEEAFLDVILHMMRILRLRVVLCRFRGRSCFRWFCRLGRRTSGPHRRFPGERQHEGFVLAFLPLFLHRKALRRTVLCAYAARHAFLAVDRPLPCLPVDRDRLHRAAVLTASAEEAFLDVILHMMRILRLRHILCRFRGRSCFRCFYLRCRGRRAHARAAGQDLALIGGDSGFIFSFSPCICKGKALRRTVKRTGAAGDALVPIDRPCTVSAVDRNGVHRTGLFTLAAEEAFFDFIFHVVVSHSRFRSCRRLRFLHDGLPRGSSSDLRDAANGDLCPISQIASE